MLTQKQLQILDIFSKNLFKEYSYQELKKMSKGKSNSFLQNTLKKLLHQKLITERKIGTSKLYKINHNNDQVYSYIEININENLKTLVKKSISLLKKELNKYGFFYSLVIFGSYANNKFQSKSDLDIAILIPNKSYENNFKIAINSAENKSLINLDAHLIKNKDFLEMLNTDYENLGKEIVRNNLPVYGSTIFYKLVNKGIKYESNIIS